MRTFRCFSLLAGSTFVRNFVFFSVSLIFTCVIILKQLFSSGSVNIYLHFVFIYYTSILDEPGTWRRTFQKLFSSQTGIWPRLFDGCHLDRETGRYVQDTGFEEVTLNYTHLPPLKIKNPILNQLTLLAVYLPNYFMLGNAKK
jgi:hypothetical protein